MNGYKTLLQEANDEYIVNKSRFIGSAAPVETPEQALAFLDKIRQQYKDATHNCYAYIIGKNAGIMRYSDDGEPGGTAGMPIIEVMKARGVVDCAVVVTRYFGGILLGGGGLVRAYSHAARLAVDAAGIVEMRRCLQLEVRCDYAQYGFLPALLAAENARITDTRYDDGVTVQFTLEANRRGALAAALTERSAGRLTLTALGEIFAPFPVAAEE